MAAAAAFYSWMIAQIQSVNSGDLPDFYLCWESASDNIGWWIYLDVACDASWLLVEKAIINSKPLFG